MKWIGTILGALAISCTTIAADRCYNVSEVAGQKVCETSFADLKVTNGLVEIGIWGMSRSGPMVMNTTSCVSALRTKIGTIEVGVNYDDLCRVGNTNVYQGFDSVLAVNNVAKITKYYEGGGGSIWFADDTMKACIVDQQKAILTALENPKRMAFMKKMGIRNLTIQVNDYRSEFYGTYNKEKFEKNWKQYFESSPSFLVLRPWGSVSIVLIRPEWTPLATTCISLSQEAFEQQFDAQSEAISKIAGAIVQKQNGKIDSGRIVCHDADGGKVVCK